MAVVAGSAAVALLGVAAQSASAAPVSAPRTTASAPAAALNCAYTVTTNTVLIADVGQLPLQEGDILYGPKVGAGSSAYLYSYFYGVSGYVWTGALHEEYCEP
jgi:hypothetical protein